MRKITLLFVLLSFTVFSFAQQREMKNFSKSKESYSFGLTKHQSNTNTGNPKTAFSESFEGTFPPTGWTRNMPDGGTGWRVDTVGSLINGFNGTNTVTGPTGGGTQVACVTYIDGGSTYNDSWLITPQLTASAGEGLTFWAANLPAYIDSLDVLVSTTTNAPASFSARLFSQILPGNSPWTKYSVNLSAYTGQPIYIAFREHVSDNSADGGYVCLDLVAIESLPTADAGVTKVFAPKTGCNLSVTEQVKITVKNFGINSASNIPVHYKFNNGTTVDGTVAGPIAPDATVDFTFPTTINASAEAVDSIVAWTTFPSDGNAGNDYAPVYYFGNTLPSTIPYAFGAEWSGAEGVESNYWSLVDVSGAGYWDYGGGSNFHTGAGYWYYLGDAAEAANDWLITKCINLTAGITYKVSFWYKNSTAGSMVNKLKLAYGTSQNPVDLTTTLIDLPNINDATAASYVQTQTWFSAPSTGTYYFGWKAYSDAGMGNFYLDDIAIDNSTEISDNSNEFRVYPNPVKDALFIESINTIEEVALYNVMGQKIYESQVNNLSASVNTSGMNTGVYFLKLKTANGYSVRKVVME